MRQETDVRPSRQPTICEIGISLSYLGTVRYGQVSSLKNQAHGVKKLLTEE
jgi:hypothetical protein